MYFGLIVPAYSYAFCEAFTDSLGKKIADLDCKTVAPGIIQTYGYSVMFSL